MMRCNHPAGKIPALLPALLLLLLSLSACLYNPAYKNSVYYNERSDLLVLYEYSVPFVGDLDVEMQGHVEIYPLEADEYGRTLGILQFKPGKRNNLFGENAVYCVLQSGSKKECCFYEDVCCVMAENGTDSKEAIQQLKRDNDWGLPVSADQCRKIPLKLDYASGVYDTGYGYTDYEAIAREAVMWPRDNARLLENHSAPWAEIHEFKEDVGWQFAGGA